eukprot:3116392-Rhodomonas_salina.3
MHGTAATINGGRPALLSRCSAQSQRTRVLSAELPPVPNPPATSLHNPVRTRPTRQRDAPHLLELCQPK